MMNLSLAQIKEKILAESELSEDELNSRIKKKLDELAGLISEEGAAHIIANELKVKLHDPDAPLTIDKLMAGLRNVELAGKVKQLYEIREFNTERRSGKVGNFLLVDGTGIIRVVLWNDQTDLMKDFKEGDIIRIKGAYVRSGNQNRLELHVSETSKVEINPEGVAVDANIEKRPEAAFKKIKELTEQDQNVNVIATVVQVFDPRFFPVCPECNSRAREENGAFVCQSHGQVNPKYNYVMNLYLDDGSDNMRCVLWREQAAKLLDKTDDDMVTIKEQPSAFEPFKTDLLGMIIKIRGRINKNDAFGRLELVAYDVEKDVDPEGEPSAPSARKEVIEKEETTVAINTPEPNTDDSQNAETDVQEQSSAPLASSPSTTTHPSPSPAPTTKPLIEIVEKKKEVVEAEEDLFTLEDIEELEDLE